MTTRNVTPKKVPAVKKTVNELDIICPEQSVEIKGKRYTIEPFSLRDMKLITIELSGALERVASAYFDATRNAGPNEEVGLPISAIISAGGDAIDGLARIIAHEYEIEEDDVLDNYNMEEIATAISHIIRLNKGFFVDGVEILMESAKDLFPTDETSPSEK